MSFKLEMKRSQFSLQLQKILPQREEHMVVMLPKAPKTHPFVFVNTEDWDTIPEDFNEVYNAMLRLGRETDGSEYGDYSLTLHGRGKKYGQFDKDKARRIAGCNISYSREKGLKVSKLSCNIDVFLMLLKQMREINFRILKTKKRGYK